MTIGTQDPRVSQLYVYPLKSAAGISLQTMEVDPLGPHLDRRWMLVDETGRFISQREMPRLALLRTSLDGSRLSVSAPNVPPLTVPEPDAAADCMCVTVWNDVVDALPIGVETDAWFSEALETPCRLVFFPDSSVRVADRAYNPEGRHVGFADGFPLLILGASSLADLNARLTNRGHSPLSVNRFRPNIVVAGAAPYAEDGWRRIALGEGISLSIVKPCARCAITTVDQATAVRGKEPLTTLAAYRRGSDGSVFSAQNAIHDRPGVVRLGDSVRVLE